MRFSWFVACALLTACDAASSPALPDASPKPDDVAGDAPPDALTFDAEPPDAPAPDAPAPDAPTPDAPTPDAPAPDASMPDVSAPDATRTDGGAGCGAFPLCDDFESSPVGGAPARWAVVSPNCSGTGRVTVDGAVAHGGSRSVRVDGGGGYCDHVFLADTAVAPTLGAVVYGRVFVRFSAAFGDGHVTFLTLRDAADGNRDLRMGGQSRIFMWNRESDDATLPELSPAGIARSARPTPLTWHCVEFRLDQGAGALQTWVDGAAVEGLTVDATPTMDVDARWLSRGMWRPRVVDWKLGWESYAGQTMTVWFDDVALAATRVGCGG
ncbi:MAG: hypothetical protein U0324_18030 [Polyangiales bacterium]